MTTTLQTWEQALLALAHEAWQSVAQVVHQPSLYDSTLLARAYAHCEAITAQHSRSFHLSSALLPREKRRATRALYAFCRMTDDIVDRPQGEEIERQLAAWRQQALSFEPDPDNLVAVAWADARYRFHIPRRYAEQLIDGVARDMKQTRYVSFDDLTTYCYGVASTVGLMSMHITGFSGPEAIPYAIKLGVALQLTNILRDVGEDLRNGRVYLPLEELMSFGIMRSDMEAGLVTPRWREFMAFQIERTRTLYDEAWHGIALLDPSGRLAIAAAADLYRRILDDIELHDYDVFSRRAYVSTWGKLRRIPGLWYRTRHMGPISTHQV